MAAQPSCFISYSWDHDAHIAWTVALAERLRAEGVRVILDRWDCPPGRDLMRFMQDAVEHSDYVLVICTPRYAKKADSGRGGAGQEATVMYGEMLTADAPVDRFLPLLRDGQAADAVPSYLKSRLYIDFRPDCNQDQAFETLRLRLFSETHGGAAAQATPVTRPLKWIRVTGTGDLASINGETQLTARHLGGYLADARFGLITGGWPGIDRMVAESFHDRILQLGLPVSEFLTQICDHWQNQTFSDGRIIVVDGAVAFTESAIYADACILLCGMGGALQTALWMRHAAKPVLPLPETGSDAKVFWQAINELWRDEMLPGVSRQEFQRLARPLPGAAREAVNLLLKWVGRPPLR